MGTKTEQDHSGVLLLNDATSLSGTVLRRVVRVGSEYIVMDVTSTNLKQRDVQDSKQVQSTNYSLPASVVCRAGADLVKVTLT